MLIEERTGICFDESRERFFSTRVREHFVAKKLAGGTELLRAIRKTNVEYEALLERLLTQETSFFRYPGVYEAFEKRLLPELHVKKFWKNPRTSARLERWLFHWRGTVFDRHHHRRRSFLRRLVEAGNPCHRCQQERPEACRTRRVQRPQRSQRQRKTTSGTFLPQVKEGYQVKARLQKMITFAQMNLASAVYVGRMDLIFCMNVLIYFTEERRRTLVQRFYDSLEPGGYLFLGHSESISKMPVKFQAIVLNDCILYRKPTAEELQKTELVTEGGVA